MIKIYILYLFNYTSHEDVLVKKNYVHKLRSDESAYQETFIIVKLIQNRVFMTSS